MARVHPRHLALLVVLVAPSAACSSSMSAPTTVAGIGRVQRAEVVAVIDGDTLDLRIGSTPERVRLLGVDTPETVHPDRPVECWGPEASRRTKELLPAGTDVLLQRDVEARDRFGRLLAYLWRARDHLFVNEALLAEGAGELLVIAPNGARRPQLAAAEAAARSAGAGRWGSCPSSDGER